MNPGSAIKQALIMLLEASLILVLRHIGNTWLKILNPAEAQIRHLVHENLVVPTNTKNYTRL